VIFTNRPVAQAFAWFAILFVVPVVLAMERAWMIQNDSLEWFYRLIELRPIGPVPTGWGVDLHPNRSMFRADHPE